MASFSMSTIFQALGILAKPSLEQLADEMILKVISYLSPWEAMAFEAVNKRMNGLVRAHQMVQEEVDITYPVKGMSKEETRRLVSNIEKMILTRFGHKLLKLSIDAHYMSQCDEMLYNTPNFMERLAIKCPNLVELPGKFDLLLAYTRGRASALKKLTICLPQIVKSDQVKELPTTIPQLEELKLIISGSDTGRMCDDINKLEGALPSTNCIRKLDIKFLLLSGILNEEIFFAIRQFTHKMTKLESFNLTTSLTKDIESAIIQLFQNIKCPEKTLNISQLTSQLISCTRALNAYITELTCNGLTSKNLAFFKNFNNVRKLTIGVVCGDVQGRFPLILPSSVRTLTLCVFSEEKLNTYFANCIRRHGKQLRHLTLVAYVSINDLLISIYESCTELESLHVRGLYSGFFDESKFETFLETRHEKLRELVISKKVKISFPTLELICQECEKLEKLVVHIKLEKSGPSAEMSSMKKLIYDAKNLSEAEIDFYSEAEKDPFAFCRYVNRKFALTFSKNYGPLSFFENLYSQLAIVLIRRG